MSDILDKRSTLVLNANWMPIRTGTVREAILAMTANSDDSDRPAVALDLEYGKNEDGRWDFDNAPISIQPVAWSEWVNLSIRDYDEVIRSARMTIRAPVILIARNYRQMPMIRFRPSGETIFKRDQGICQYSGKKISKESGSIDHIQSRFSGGKDTFENMVWCDKNINSKKGHKTLQEAGLKLIRQPKAPAAMPATALISGEARDWKWFLVKNH